MSESNYRFEAQIWTTRVEKGGNMSISKLFAAMGAFSLAVILVSPGLAQADDAVAQEVMPSGRR